MKEIHLDKGERGHILVDKKLKIRTVRKPEFPIYFGIYSLSMEENTDNFILKKKKKM